MTQWWSVLGQTHDLETACWCLTGPTEFYLGVSLGKTLQNLSLVEARKNMNIWAVAMKWQIMLNCHNITFSQSIFQMNTFATNIEIVIPHAQHRLFSHFSHIKCQFKLITHQFIRNSRVVATCTQKCSCVHTVKTELVPGTIVKYMYVSNTHKEPRVTVYIKKISWVRPPPYPSGRLGRDILFPHDPHPPHICGSKLHWYPQHQLLVHFDLGMQHPCFPYSSATILFQDATMT